MRVENTVYNFRYIYIALIKYHFYILIRNFKYWIF